MRKSIVRLINIGIPLLCVFALSCSILLSSGSAGTSIDNIQNKIDYTKNIVLVLPADCLQILSASDGKNGLLVTYKSAVCEKTRAALYPNANDGDKPSFIFTFVKE